MDRGFFFFFFNEIWSFSGAGLPDYKIPFFLSEARRGSERKSLHLVGNGSSQIGVNATKIHIKQPAARSRGVGGGHQCHPALDSGETQTSTGCFFLCWVHALHPQNNDLSLTLTLEEIRIGCPRQESFKELLPVGS